MILVKIGRMGGKVSEFALDFGISVGKALERAQLQRQADEVITINGNNNSSINTTINNGDIILLKKNTIENITVKVGRAGSPLTPVTVKKGSTVRTVLSHGWIPNKNEDIWLTSRSPDPQLVNLQMVVVDNDILIIEEKQLMKTIIKYIEEFDEEGYYEDYGSLADRVIGTCRQFFKKEV